MIKLAFTTKTWAANHANAARIVIAVCYALIFACVVFLESLLSRLGVRLPGTWLWVALGVVAALFAVHTVLHKYFFIRNWWLVQRGFGFTVLMISFFGVLVALNQPSGTFPLLQQRSYAAFPSAARGVRTEQMHKINTMPQDGPFSVLTQVLLVVLVIALVYILGVLLAVLACSLACSGYALLATVVAIVGGAGILYGAIIAFMAIFGHHHRHRHYYY